MRWLGPRFEVLSEVEWVLVELRKVPLCGPTRGKRKLLDFMDTVATVLTTETGD